jgi:hypothetical protein
VNKQVSSLYVLADGTHAKPGDCEKDDDGVLRHIYGMPVALREDGEPMTVGQGAVDNKNEEAAQAGETAEAPAEEPERVAKPGVLETIVDPATGETSDDKPTAATAPGEEASAGKRQKPRDEKEVSTDGGGPFKNREVKSK